MNMKPKSVPDCLSAIATVIEQLQQVEMHKFPSSTREFVAMILC